MKTFFTTMLIFLVLMLLLGFIFRDQLQDFLGLRTMVEKPILYLYPEEETEIDVSLHLNGDLTCTYPAYNDGWHVTAAPDGTLTDENGQEYYALYWEGEVSTDTDFTAGYCIPGTETAAFLADILPQLGLNAREANEFILYWLPQMQENAYNLISFASDAYTDAAELDITPAPDTLIRVFMSWKPLTQAVEIATPVLPETPIRVGFTAVEWGGAELS